MTVSVLPVLQKAVVAVRSTVAGAGSAVAVTRLAVRIRFFSLSERFGDTWHGRPVRQGDREFQDGLNPAPIAFVAFWVACTTTMDLLDSIIVG